MTDGGGTPLTSGVLLEMLENGIVWCAGKQLRCTELAKARFAQAWPEMDRSGLEYK